MTDHFEGLRIHPTRLEDRRDADWEMDEQGQERRVQVLRALQAAVHDALIVRALHRRETGQEMDEDAEHELWNPIWDGLRDTLTRQDLLRWLVDWATHSQQEPALGTIVRMHEELSMLDDESGAWWLTQNPG